MPFNPVKRGLVEHPKEWEWSSYLFYWKGEKGLCPPSPGWQPKNDMARKHKKAAHALLRAQSAAAPAQQLKPNFSENCRSRA